MAGKKFVIGTVVLSVVIAVVVGFALFVLPVGHSISGQVATAYCASCTSGVNHYFGYTTTNFPSGSDVTINWQSTSSSWVEFSIFSDGNLNGGGCSQDGTSGSCSFTSQGGTYSFALSDGDASQTVETVTWSGSYTAPML